MLRRSRALTIPAVHLRQRQIETPSTCSELEHRARSTSEFYSHGSRPTTTMSRAGTTRQNEPEFQSVGSIVLFGNGACTDRGP
jgi:hypothetical protein